MVFATTNAGINGDTVKMDYIASNTTPKESLKKMQNDKGFGLKIVKNEQRQDGDEI